MIYVPATTDILIVSLLISIGTISGIYHGIFNSDIYHAGDKENVHKKIHTIWIHFVSGIIGSLCLFALFQKFVNNYSLNITVADIGILLLAMLGIAGLLPMTLWFMVLSINKLQDTFLEFIKKLIK